VKPLFADTSFFIALMNVEDLVHADAHHYMAREGIDIVTTDWVLVEVGNYLSRRLGRERFEPLVADLLIDPRFGIFNADHEDFESGLQLYHQRQDKHWSMNRLHFIQRDGPRRIDGRPDFGSPL